MVMHVNEAGQKSDVPQIESVLRGVLYQIPGMPDPVDPVAPDDDGCILGHRRSRSIEEPSCGDDHGTWLQGEHSAVSHQRSFSPDALGPG
jgi:hypothetical protein